MLLPDLLEQSAIRFPNKAALVFPGAKCTFSAMDTQSNQVASRLRRLNVGAGVRVAIVHENAIDAVVFFWGILKSGAEVVDVPSLAGVDTIANILNECKPAVLVASERQFHRLSARCSSSLPAIVVVPSPTETAGSVQEHSLREITSSEKAEAPLRSGHDCDVALIVYTSGSTGEPKGVMLSHRNLLSNISAANSLVRLNSEDSILVVVPLYFIHGRMQLLTHALIGGTMFFSAGFQFPQQVVRDLQDYRVTGFSGVPFHFSTLLAQTDLGSRRFPHLRYVLVTGGAMPPQAIQKLSAALPNVDVHIAYGQTEASPRISYLAPSEVVGNPSSSGKALPGVNVELVAEDGSGVSVGEVGEIVASGPNIMCGYVSGDEFSCGKLDAFGRLHTGDLGKLDNNGYLYVVGRKSEMIKCAGERIFPKEIEAVLELHPAIRESSVFGVPDPLLGEKIVACLVAQPNMEMTAGDIRSHCLQFLPLVRVPREIRFTDSLPKTGSGKIDKPAIIAQFDQLTQAVRAA